MRKRLREARKAKGLTQQQVADRLGITLRYYQMIEQGERDGNFEVWDALEDLLEIHQRQLRVITIRPSDLFPKDTTDGSAQEEKSSNNGMRPSR